MSSSLILGQLRVLRFASAAETGPELVATEADLEPGKDNENFGDEPLNISDSESSVASDVELSLDLAGEGHSGIDRLSRRSSQ